MKRTIKAQSGHTLCVIPILFGELPDAIRNGEHAKNYTDFYVVKNWDATGKTFMYLARGYKDAPKQIVVFYPKGEFWISYGTSFKAAIDGAQQDGWMYA